MTVLTDFRFLYNQNYEIKEALFHMVLGNISSKHIYCLAGKFDVSTLEFDQVGLLENKNAKIGSEKI